MKRIAEMSGGHLGTFDIISVGFVDDDPVGHLHNPSLDALQLIARTGQLDKQEEIDHRMYGRFALSHTDRLDEDGIESGRFAENNRFARLTGYSAQ